MTWHYDVDTGIMTWILNEVSLLVLFLVGIPVDEFC